jgi:hemin uptake protein HemP
MAGSNAAQRIRTSHDAAREAASLRAIREAISAATLRPEHEAAEELRAGLEPVGHKL